MENEELINEKNLIEEIKQLESQNNTANNKLQRLENDIKKRMQEKLFYEASIDDLKENIEYYTKFTAKLRKRLRDAKHVHSQFNMAAQCYEKLMSDYSETYIHYETEDKTTSNITIEESTEVIQKISDLERKIDEHNGQIDQLLKCLEVSSEGQDLPISDD